MKVKWSHAVINVRNLEKMLDFYRQVLGFVISDRGPIVPSGPEIVFLSTDADEHHQLAMVASRNDEAGGGALNHFAFRLAEFEDVQAIHHRLMAWEGSKPFPLSHGNALSVYFADPEGNGVEVFWDTPWHVAQPHGKPWDIDLDRAGALAWVEETFSTDPTFIRREAATHAHVNR